MNFIKINQIEGNFNEIIKKKYLKVRFFLFFLGFDLILSFVKKFVIIIVIIYNKNDLNNRKWTMLNDAENKEKPL